MMTENNMSKLGRLEDYDKILPIVEISRVIQCEGSRVGTPTFIIRTSGCSHRCFFREGGWCDSWYTSIHPEKGTLTFNDIIKAYDENPHIKEMMITGGSPTMHGKLVNELTHFANERDLLVTIETEGSHFLETDFPIDLISLSPKFSNSIPVLGVETPKGKITDQKMIDQHNKLRLNTEAINKTLAYHTNFHYKPVWDGTEGSFNEIEDFRIKHGIAKRDTYLMPAGDTRDELIRMYPVVIEKCAEVGYNFTGRAHIIAYSDLRGV